MRTLITGTSQGIGKALAQIFLDNGHEVIGFDRQDAGITHERYTHFCLDVRGDLPEITDVEILINNAGGGIAIKETADLSVEEIDKTIKLNLNSVIYGSRAFADMMKEAKTGTVINVSSVCARHCWPGWSVYAAAKAGVLNFSKGFYVEMQPYNVRVTCVIPASASTGLQSACGIGETYDALMIEDIADTVMYVCNLPQRATVEDVTVWGIGQVVNPL